LVICEHFWPYVWNNWSWVMHTMSTWFWPKIGYGSNVGKHGFHEDKPHLGLVGPRLFATSSPRVILSEANPSFGHNEDMYGFWSIWCFSVIRCSWSGRSAKLLELISNRHLSSISCMKCRYVGGKYMHFITANTPGSNVSKGHPGHRPPQRLECSGTKTNTREALQVHRIVNVAHHREYSPSIVFIFFPR
jgi:hypothetical protein